MSAKKKKAAKKQAVNPPAKSVKRSSSTPAITDAAQEMYKSKEKELGIDRENDVFAITAFITSVIGFGVGFLLGLLAVPFSLAAFVLAIIALFRIKKNPKSKGVGFAIAALIMSILQIIGAIIGIIILAGLLYSMI